MTQGLSPPTPTPRPMYPPFAAWVLLRLTPGLSLSVVFALACHQAGAAILADSTHAVHVVITLGWLRSS